MCISFWLKNMCDLFIIGRWPSSNLHVNGWSSSGVQQAGKPQCSDVFSISALPCTRQSSLELELSSSKLYPFKLKSLFVVIFIDDLIMAKSTSSLQVCKVLLLERKYVFKKWNLIFFSFYNVQCSGLLTGFKISFTAL